VLFVLVVVEPDFRLLQLLLGLLAAVLALAGKTISLWFQVKATLL
jgi:hypothetical protein